MDDALALRFPQFFGLSPDDAGADFPVVEHGDNAFAGAFHPPAGEGQDRLGFDGFARGLGQELAETVRIAPDLVQSIGAGGVRELKLGAVKDDLGF